MGEDKPFVNNFYYFQGAGIILQFLCRIIQMKTSN